MDNVVPLKRPGEQWATGPVTCLRCKYEWIAVRKLPDPVFDCPKCGCHAGVPAGIFGGKPDDAVWVCSCGCTMLNLVVDKSGREDLMCVGCGASRK